MGKRNPTKFSSTGNYGCHYTSELLLQNRVHLSTALTLDNLALADFWLTSQYRIKVMEMEQAHGYTSSMNTEMPTKSKNVYMLFIYFSQEEQMLKRHI